MELSWSEDAVGKDDWDSAIVFDGGVLRGTSSTISSAIDIAIVIAIVIANTDDPIFNCTLGLSSDDLVPPNPTHGTRHTQ